MIRRGGMIMNHLRGSARLRKRISRDTYQQIGVNVPNHGVIEYVAAFISMQFKTAEWYTRPRRRTEDPRENRNPF